jgi:hypothetical protein
MRPWYEKPNRRGRFQHIDCRDSYSFGNKLAVVSPSARARPRMTDMHGYKCVFKRIDTDMIGIGEYSQTGNSQPGGRGGNYHPVPPGSSLSCMSSDMPAKGSWGCSSRAMYRFMHRFMYEVVYSVSMSIQGTVGLRPDEEKVPKGPTCIIVNFAQVKRAAETRSNTETPLCARRPTITGLLSR